MSDFGPAVAYVLSNEGGDSDDANDHGGRTRFGITEAEAKRYGYDVRTLTIDQAHTIYRTGYWNFDMVNDQRCASKFLDVVVNVGPIGVRLIQRAVGAAADGMFGPWTAEHANAMEPEDVLERLSTNVADRYVDIVLRDATQLKFLKGWIRRAIRRPR